MVAILVQRFAGGLVENAVLAKIGIFGSRPAEKNLPEVEALKLENRLLEEKLVGMDELSRENTVLRQLLYDYIPWTPQKFLARVLAAAPLRPNEFLYIDQGASRGVKVGAMVIAAQTTLVGRVKEVYDRSALVETVLSKDLKITARISRTGAEGLVANVGGLPVLTLIPKDADVKTGDLVVTSGRDAAFIAGFLIGKVVAVETDETSSVKSARFQPAVNPAELETVILLEHENH